MLYITLTGFISWLKNNSKPCFYKEHFGFECLGCGFQRSLIALLEGNITESFKQYPALVPLMLTFGFLLVHLKFKFNKGPVILKTLFILTCVLIVGNYLFKLTLKIN